MRHLKQEFDKLSFKEALTYGLAVASLTAAFVLLFMGLLIPPEGEIHQSVLTAFGIVLLFVGTVLGIDMKYADRTARFKEEITSHIEKAFSAHRREDMEEEAGT